MQSNVLQSVLVWDMADREFKGLRCIYNYTACFHIIYHTTTLIILTLNILCDRKISDSHRSD
jgi:hypothetical protein